jgi:hypothetical protein
MKNTIIVCLSIIICLLAGGVIVAKDFKMIKEQPCNPVMQALTERHSTKTFLEQKLEKKDLSSILWAAVGINRPEFDDDSNVIGGKLTIPTAMDRQPITVYAVLEQGVYRYDPVDDGLVLIMEGDYRAEAAFQPAYHIAPLHLIFVVDLTKYSGSNPGGVFSNRDELVYSNAISVGCAAQNVYLYLAGTKKLGGTYRTAMDKALWHGYLGLPVLYDELGEYASPDKLVMGGMTIGYPAPTE